MLEDLLSLSLSNIEIALPEMLHREFWTWKMKLLGAASTILGCLLGKYSDKKWNPLRFVFRRLEKRWERKAREEEDERAFWKRWN